MVPNEIIDHSFAQIILISPFLWPGHVQNVKDSAFYHVQHAIGLAKVSLLSKRKYINTDLLCLILNLDVRILLCIGESDKSSTGTN